MENIGMAHQYLFSLKETLREILGSICIHVSCVSQPHTSKEEYNN